MLGIIIAKQKAKWNPLDTTITIVYTIYRDENTKLKNLLKNKTQNHNKIKKCESKQILDIICHVELVKLAGNALHITLKLIKILVLSYCSYKLLCK